MLPAELTRVFVNLRKIRENNEDIYFVVLVWLLNSECQLYVHVLTKCRTRLTYASEKQALCSIPRDAFSTNQETWVSLVILLK